MQIVIQLKIKIYVIKKVLKEKVVILIDIVINKMNKEENLF